MMSIIYLNRSISSPIAGLRAMGDAIAESSKLEKALLDGYTGEQERSFIQKILAFFTGDNRNIALAMIKEFGAAVRNFQQTDITADERDKFKIRALAIIGAMREKVSCGTLKDFDELIAPKLALLREELVDVEPDRDELVAPKLARLKEEFVDVEPDRDAVEIAPGIFRKMEPTSRIVGWRPGYNPTEFVSLNKYEQSKMASLEADKRLSELSERPTGLLLTPLETTTSIPIDEVVNSPDEGWVVVHFPNSGANSEGLSTGPFAPRTSLLAPSE